MKNCLKCGKELEDTMDFCNACGMKQTEENGAFIGTVSTNNKVTENTQTNINIFALISAIIGVLFWFYGFYKYLSYDSGEYSDPVNAYVGGDAYNYIINGTYFTAFAVIGGVFILGAFILYSASYLKK